MDAHGRLPEGLHRGTFKDLRIRFVDGAPHPERREMLMDALEFYADQVWSLLPTARLWVNGGFVTHKPWAPKDIDVVNVVRAREIDCLDLPTLLPLLTHEAQDGSRVQPMGGLIDGFHAVRGDAEKLLYWQDWWSTVTDVDGNAIPGIRKGYVEVVAP
ncbi:hypothetical protein A6F55_09240 [Prescottella equi]|uniref:DUF6932 family protein n=1 Tax=Rhodococcus hoagii TaxID=43767 RepID=UPI000A22DF31|nr:hypothetical protein [Prescottella equi]ORL03395.1 hypothetical protein A6F55_09240 [Prescottella equi]